MLAILESDFEQFMNWFLNNPDDGGVISDLIIKYTEDEDIKLYVNKNYVYTIGKTKKGIYEIYKKPFELVRCLKKQSNLEHIARFAKATDLNEEQIGRTILLYSEKIIMETQEPLKTINCIIETAQKILECKNKDEKTLLKIKLEAYWLYTDVIMFADIKAWISEMPKGEILDDYILLTADSLYSILLEAYRRNCEKKDSKSI